MMPDATVKYLCNTHGSVIEFDVVPSSPPITCPHRGCGQLLKRADQVVVQTRDVAAFEPPESNVVQFPTADQRARRGDPDTSHMAAEGVNVGKQARRILGAYVDGDALLDVEAYERAGYPMTNNRGQRCSDLRHAELIERTGTKRKTPNGALAHECRITDAGRAYLAT